MCEGFRIPLPPKIVDIGRSVVIVLPSVVDGPLVHRGLSIRGLRSGVQKEILAAAIAGTVIPRSSSAGRRIEKAIRADAANRKVPTDYLADLLPGRRDKKIFDQASQVVALLNAPWPQHEKIAIVAAVLMHGDAALVRLQGMWSWEQR
jgi:hypothetical protein